MAAEISSFLSHITWDTMLFGLRLVLCQVMGLKGSDTAPTLAAAAPTPQNHAQGGAGLCAASQLFEAGPGGHGARITPLQTWEVEL